MVDFRDQLRRQIEFLKASCRLHDEENVEEAIRIAVTLRVIFHDTNSSISLLKHLGSKSISLLSTAEIFKRPQDHNLGLVTTLTRADVSSREIICEMQPVLGDPTRREFVSFQSWWRKERIIELGGPNILNRRDLILAAANKDGGAHVDAALDPTYDKVRLGADYSIEVDFKDPPKTAVSSPRNIHYASLRQIAYEVLNSPDLTKLALAPGK